MTRDVLDVAKSLMRRRHFDKAIKLLDGRAEIYSQNFDYYLLFGIACLYIGDTGAASSYFQKARNLRLTDTNLLLGQAALFLRRGDTSRALQYYIDILSNDPCNKTAKKAMNFIRNNGDYNTICRWVDTGRLEEFYPPLGVNPYKVMGVVFPLFACVLGIFCTANFVQFSKPELGTREDLSAYVLSVDERKNAQETDLSSGSFSYILSSKQILDSYEKAQRYFQNYQDNLAQIEINRILCSNASVSIKQKARELMNFIEPPSFDSIKDSPEYSMVEKEPNLYLSCWVSWSGRVSNIEQTESSFKCDLLVGYDTMRSVKGIVPVYFKVAPVMDVEKPVTILAKITSKDGKLALEGRSTYQSVK